jgi:hypothetical protein
MNPGDWSRSSGLIAHEALHKFGLIDTDINQSSLTLRVSPENIHLYTVDQ